VPQGIDIPLEELFDTETFAFYSNSIKMWVSHEEVLFNILGASFEWVDILFILKVEESKVHDWQGCHCNVIKLVDKWLIERLT